MLRLRPRNSISPGMPRFVVRLSDPVGAVLGRRRWYPHVPAFVGRLVASREQVLRLAEDKDADVGPARAAFGYAPRALEEGLRAEA